MPDHFESLLKKYDYQLPERLIAQEPASPRDSARLLIYNKKTKAVAFDVFKNLGQYLPANSVLVFNQTKVVPARLPIHKESGGKGELLYLSHDQDTIKAIANRKLPVGSSLNLAGDRKLTLKVVRQEGQFYFLEPSFSLSKISSVLKKFGKTPLPPYIKHSKLNEKQRREKYQTVFAKNGLSVAAPTASLHFTKNLIRDLKKRGIKVVYITLNVNMGTFAPLKEENLQTGKLHTETYSINKNTARLLNRAKNSGQPIIAVGTTVIRALESAAMDGKLKNLAGTTDIFIQEGYKFKFVNSFITNFHVPKSSLLMLVAAFLGRTVLFKLYSTAIRKKFKFFSFGDGMLAINQ